VKPDWQADVLSEAAMLQSLLQQMQQEIAGGCKPHHVLDMVALCSNRLDSIKQRVIPFPIIEYPDRRTE
jgi:hypothetical protein